MLTVIVLSPLVRDGMKSTTLGRCVRYQLKEGKLLDLKKQNHLLIEGYKTDVSPQYFDKKEKCEGWLLMFANIY